MNRDELLDLAATLTRHLATVLANEQGFVEIACPECRPSSRRGWRGTQAVSPSPVAARDTGSAPRSDGATEGATGLARGDAPAQGVCPTCEGTTRMWAKTTAGEIRRMSDRAVVDAFGADRSPGGTTRRGPSRAERGPDAALGEKR